MLTKNFTPFPTLKTERLTLRQLAGSDENEIFALRSNEEVNKYLARKPSESISAARQFINTINESIQQNESAYWAIILNDTDELAGTVCLYGFSGADAKAEIGYELLPAFQGKGFMQEAISKVIEFGSEVCGLQIIEAYTHCENKGSIRLLEKLHFKKEAVADENMLTYTLVLS